MDSISSNIVGNQKADIQQMGRAAVAAQYCLGQPASRVPSLGLHPDSALSSHSLLMHIVTWQCWLRRLVRATAQETCTRSVSSVFGSALLGHFRHLGSDQRAGTLCISLLFSQCLQRKFDSIPYGHNVSKMLISLCVSFKIFGLASRIFTFYGV